jgi:phosphopantothenoylcysteine decarboxylase/phosphopantothenate--cysteine ligase
MSDFAHIFAQIIQRLGGRDAVQSLLGVGPSALSNYLRRAELPHDKVTIIKKALRAEGWSFDPEKLHLNPLTSQTKKQVLLIITGGIAAYKGLDLARRLMDRGFSVRGVMTKSAQEFITPLSLSALTKDRVYTELFSLTDEAEMGHIRLARDTDLVLIAPATANFIAKLSHVGPSHESKYVAAPRNTGQFSLSGKARCKDYRARHRRYRLRRDRDRPSG